MLFPMSTPGHDGALPIRELPDPSDVSRAVRFALVDVFGEGPLTGNPLAVLDLANFRTGYPAESWMAAVAREMNQAETTFVFPATATAQARLRSFTAGGVEVFGAGHNALGAWWWLLETGRVRQPPYGSALVQEIGGRDLYVDVDGGQLVMRQERPVLGAEPDRGALAEAVGLDPDRLDPDLPPRVVGTGADHLMVAVRDPYALAACRPDRQLLADVTASIGAQGLYVAVLGSDRPVSAVQTRFFNPGVGLDEDPATGSAAGPLAAYLDHLGLLPQGGRLRVDQGRSMGRPSTLSAHITQDGHAAVGGTAVVTAQGWIQGPEV